MAARTSASGTTGGAFLAAALAFLVFVGIAMVAMRWLALDAVVGSAARTERMMLAQAFAHLALVLLVVLLPVGIGWRPRGAARVVGVYAAFAVVWVPISMLLYPLVLEWLDRPIVAQDTLRYFVEPAAAPWGRFVVIGGACLSGPIAEEILYRGYLLGALQRLLPAGAANLLTAALFGAMHGSVYAFPTFLLGLLFGWLRQRHGSMFAPALAHVLHNSLTVSVTLLFPEMFHEVFPS